MAFIRKRMLERKERHYLEESVRLPDGKVKKYSVYLKEYDPKKDLEEEKKRLKSLIVEDLSKEACSFYKRDHIFNEDLLKRVEESRMGYKEILRKLSKKQMQDVIDRFTINFTYESNAIEGNSLTLKDVTMILHEGKIVKAKDLREVYETLNTREAIELLIKKKIKVNEKDILKLHEVLMKNTGIAPGYKQFPNFLLGRKVKTIPPEKVIEEMKSLIEWYQENEKFHPLERAALFHGRFERIHPFEDGNGRVGRMLINVILVSNGYPPLIIRKSHRLAYFSALEAFDNGHKEKLIRFLVEKYKNTYENFFKVYVRYLKN